MIPYRPNYLADSCVPVVWITGLAGAGKTTLADRVWAELRPTLPNIVRLDGDAVREIWGGELGYTLEDRITNAERLSRLALCLHRQGLVVVCSTMSLYPQIWDWNREHFNSYIEVYLRVNMEVLQARNKKGLYSTSNADDGQTVVGRGQEFHEPTAAHLTLVNETVENLESNVIQIVQAIRQSMNLRGQIL